MFYCTETEIKIKNILNEFRSMVINIVVDNTDKGGDKPTSEKLLSCIVKLIQNCTRYSFKGTQTRILAEMKLLTSSKSNIKMSTETSQSTCASWCTSWFPHCMHRFATILLNKPLPQDFPRCMCWTEDLFLAHWLARVYAHQLVFDHILCVRICPKEKCQHELYIYILNSWFMSTG